MPQREIANNSIGYNLSDLVRTLFKYPDGRTKRRDTKPLTEKSKELAPRLGKILSYCFLSRSQGMKILRLAQTCVVHLRNCAEL